MVRATTITFWGTGMWAIPVWMQIQTPGKVRPNVQTYIWYARELGFTRTQGDFGVHSSRQISMRVPWSDKGARQSSNPRNTVFKGRHTDNLKGSYVHIRRQGWLSHSNSRWTLTWSTLWTTMPSEGYSEGDAVSSAKSIGSYWQNPRLE